MDRTSLFAWEFYAFLAVAAWLFYTQFLKPWLTRGRQGSETAPQERVGDDAADRSREP